MESNFDKVKNFLLDLEYEIVHEDTEDEIFIVENETVGINNLFIAITDEILIIEQFLFEVKADSKDIFKELLIKNRDIIHGAFALEEHGKKVVFRDTLQIENLDSNELEGTLNSLEVLLSEYANRIIEFSA